jgi:acyl-CoA thioesterase FadM
VIRHAEIDWLKPLTLDHDAIATVCVRKMGNASAVLEQTIESNGHLSAKGILTLVCVDTRLNKPKGIPDSLRALFESTMGEPV